MSAKLMKLIASGNARVRNTRSGQVRIYWELDGKRQPPIDIDGHATMDLLTVAPAAALRRNKSLAALMHDGHLVEA